MWRPPQRIKWHTDPGQWPTADEAARSLLFSPIDVGTMRLSSRTWIPAMVPWRATEEGFVTPENIEWYARFAQGRPGAIVVEATAVRDVPSGPLLRIGDDRFIPGLKDLVEAVRIASDGQTRLLIQIIDFLSVRRRPERDKFLQRFLKITDRHRTAMGAQGMPDDEVRALLSAVPDAELEHILDEREFEAVRMGYRERLTDMALSHIRDLPQVLPELFAQAARRSREAGFDGVELHYAHAYTMASFLSARNTRADGYGGTRENRIRLPLEVYRRVREVVGNDYTLGCRFLSEECIEGGSTLDDAAYFGVEFARTGMDFLSMSRGGKFEDAKQPGIGWAAYPYTGPSGYECMPQYISDERGPFGRNIEPVARIRSAIRDAGFATPVVLAGGIHGFGQAEQLLHAGRADIIGLARQSLADPDWFEKVRLGQGKEVVVCEYTNYCEALDQKHNQVTCQLWDRKQLDEPGVSKTRDGKRRLTPPRWRADSAETAG
ncbi:MAG: NADH:flavin oxidoreductase [Betaproteobacteria bacterium]|nr:NADH:flavin oxidoreductase [Betaproteobacteria bacterium]